MSFNPELETDDTYQRFVVNPPPNAVLVKTSFRDNPSLSEELRLEIEHLKATDPDEYECVYEGMCRQQSPVRSARMSYSQQTKRRVSAVYRMTPASLLTPSGSWDISITFRSGWLSLSGLRYQGYGLFTSVMCASSRPRPGPSPISLFAPLRFSGGRRHSFCGASVLMVLTRRLGGTTVEHPA